MSTNLRCTRRSCRKRLSIPAGRAIPLCPSCGSHLAIDPEPKRRTRLQTCYCDGLPYPHRCTTLGCNHGPLLDDDEYDPRAHLRRLQRANRLW